MRRSACQELAQVVVVARDVPQVGVAFVAHVGQRLVARVYRLRRVRVLRRRGEDIYHIKYLTSCIGDDVIPSLTQCWELLKARNSTHDSMMGTARSE